MVYNTLLDVTQVNSPNAMQQDFTYDTVHRPTTAEMETGATVSYTYSADGRVTTATVNGKFTRTTTDGLGRAVKVEKGYGTAPGTVVSIVESESAPCACSPVGKLWRVSRPYARTVIGKGGEGGAEVRLQCPAWGGSDRADWEASARGFTMRWRIPRGEFVVQLSDICV